jgi:hypothetical protein
LRFISRNGAKKMRAENAHYLKSAAPRASMGTRPRCSKDQKSEGLLKACNFQEIGFRNAYFLEIKVPMKGSDPFQKSQLGRSLSF